MYQQQETIHLLCASPVQSSKNTSPVGFLILRDHQRDIRQESRMVTWVAGTWDHQESCFKDTDELLEICPPVCEKERNASKCFQDLIQCRD
jgi:hypothetical protein